MYIKSRLYGKLFNAFKLFGALCRGFPVIRRHLKKRRNVFVMLKLHYIAQAAGFFVLKTLIGNVLLLIFIRAVIYCGFKLPKMARPGHDVNVISAGLEHAQILFAAKRTEHVEHEVGAFASHRQ